MRELILTPKDAVNLMLVYGLVGLAIAGGVVTLTEVTSRVVPVFPRNGQLLVDFTMTPTVGSESAGTAAQNLTLNVTTDSIAVHRTGEFDLSGGWATVLNTTRTITLQSGKRVNLDSLTLPEGNITLVRISVENAAVQQLADGPWEPVSVPSSRLEMPVSAQVRAQSITHIVVDIHLVCPGTSGGPASSHAECMITPVLHVEE